MDINFKMMGKFALGGFVAFTLSACSIYPENDRPVDVGNTLDQFNALEKVAPTYANVSVSYEFGFSDQDQLNSTGDDIWLYSGRLDDMKNRFLQVAYIEQTPDDNILPGAVITQGRKRITGYDTCIAKDRVLSDEEQILFGSFLEKFDEAMSQSDMPKTDLFVRRFVENDTPEDAKRLETVYYISLDDMGQSCDSFDLNTEEGLNQLTDWRAEALRSFEIIG